MKDKLLKADYKNPTFSDMSAMVGAKGVGTVCFECGWEM